MIIKNKLTMTTTCVSCGSETTGEIYLDHLGSHTICRQCGARFDLLPDQTCFINCFRDSYAFLSNFYPCHIVSDGLVFGSVEAAFQAYKCADRSDREAFQYYSGRAAKSEGKRVKLRSGWDGMKVNILRELLHIKFHTSPLLKKQLVETGSAYLVECNTWHDNFYGQCCCPGCNDKTGENILGKALMETRSYLTGGIMRTLHPAEQITR